MLPVDRRRLRALEVALAVWVLLWLAMGVVTGVQIRNLTDVSDSLVTSAAALDSAGVALQTVGELPFVGDTTRRLGNEVRTTARDVQEAGASSAETFRWLSVLLGTAVALIPTIPVVGLYVPFRLSLNRQRRGIREALRNREGDPRLEEFLARRAVQNLPYDVLRAVSDDPLDDLERRSYRRLANAELTRLGLARKRR